MCRKVMLLVTTLLVAFIMNTTCSKAEDNTNLFTSTVESAIEPTPTLPAGNYEEPPVEPTREPTREPAREPIQEPTQELQQESSKKPVPVKNDDTVKVVISFAGDCTIGTDTAFGYRYSFPYTLKLNRNDYSYFFSGIKKIFESDDLTLVNLETTLTKATIPAVKKFRFKGDPEYVNILKEGSIEVVNIANNHTMDYLKEGYNDTLSALKNAGVSFSGGEHMPVVEVKGIKVAFIGYTAWDSGLKKKLLKSLKQAKAEAQIAIVTFHWGEERVYKQSEEQKELAHFCIDNGADAVIGHHPHVLQGVEAYNGRYIAYSLGNFCFGGNSNPADKDTMIFRNEFEIKEGKIDKVNAEIIPCSISSSRNINDYRPVVLDGGEKTRVLDKIRKEGW